jgi:hypothetical protein
MQSVTGEVLDPASSLGAVGLSTCSIVELGPQVSILIVVNGRRKEVSSSRLTWSGLVDLAFPQAAHGPLIEYNVTYSNGPEPNPSGMMVEGQSVQLQQEMTFDVTRTDRS